MSKIGALVIVLCLAGTVGRVSAQQVADYDAVLPPYPAESRQFCEAAPACARMLRPVESATTTTARRDR